MPNGQVSGGHPSAEACLTCGEMCHDRLTRDTKDQTETPDLPLSVLAALCSDTVHRFRCLGLGTVGGEPRLLFCARASARRARARPPPQPTLFLEERAARYLCREATAWLKRHRSAHSWTPRGLVTFWGLSGVVLGVLRVSDAQPMSADYYREKAEEIRGFAWRCPFPEISEELFELAERFDRMAAAAEKRQRIRNLIRPLS
jgi:hypothetical protein